MVIRLATTEDAKELLDIYSQYIDTPITFEYTLPTEAEFAKRIEDIGKDYPYLVCEDGGKICGYAYAHRHMERMAYQWNVELSVYIAKEYVSRGIGRRLYTVLLEILKLQGIKTAYALVTVLNEKSERLHEGLGFERIGTYHSTGYKNGSWHDVAIFEKRIAECDSVPEKVLKIGEVNWSL